MKKPIISLLALLVSASVFSQALPAPVPRVVFPATVVGNVVTYGPMTADASNAAKFSFGAAANGSVFANTGTSLATAGGSSVNLAVSSTVGNLAIAKAVGRFALKALPVFNTGVALYDLAVELGYNAKVGINGTPSFSVVQSANVYTTPCGGTGESGNGSIQQVGEQCAANYQRYGRTSYGLPSCTVTGGAASANTWFTVGTNCEGSFNYTRTASLVSSGTTEVPKTSQDLADSIAAKSGWPAGSSIARAVVDALNSGESVAVEPATVTGPATSPGTSSQTNTANDPATNSSPNPANNPNTSTTTQTQTNNHTYNGPSVTTTTTTTNTTVNNSTGAVTSNSTTTTAPVAPVPPAESVTCGLPGKPACKIDETGTPDPDPLIDGKKVAADAMAKLKDFGANPQAALPALPSLNWAFRLPTGCVPLQITAFAPFLQTIDICQFQPMFHDIMGMVWTIGGLFGAIGLFWRNTLSQN